MPELAERMTAIWSSITWDETTFAVITIVVLVSFIGMFFDAIRQGGTR